MGEKTALTNLGVRGESREHPAVGSSDVGGLSRRNLNRRSEWSQTRVRILHIRDFASVARNLADAQTALGHRARVMARRERIVEAPDVVLPAAMDPIRAQLAIVRHQADLRAADVLHIHGGISRTELVWPFLRRAFPQKVFVVQLHGSDARTGMGLHHLAVADRVFCSTPDLVRFVPGSEWLPNPVSVPAQPSGIPPGKAVVGHFPTRRAIKGTPLILDAFRGLGATSQSNPEPGLTRLENETAVLLVVEDQPHARALEIMDRCALVIDQVNDLGIYSMVAVEGMARGKVVFSSFDPGLYPFPLPIVRLSPESLGPILEKWLQEPASWTARGREGRDFVERVHRAERVAGQTLRAYYRSLGREKLLGAELKRYWKARGPGYRGEFIPGTERIERAAFGEKVLIDALRGLEFRSYVEVGCGFGRIMKRVVDAFAPDAVGVDLSLDQLQEAREYVPTAAGHLAAAIAERLPLRDQSADLVLASEVLMHLDPEQVATAIHEMTRVTRRYIVSVDWYEDFMVGEQVIHNFVHDYPALYAREGLSVRHVPVGGFTLHSMFIAERR